MMVFPPTQLRCARVAELVDALDSGSSGGNPVQVRVLSRAPYWFSTSPEAETPRDFLLVENHCVHFMSISAEQSFLR